MAGMYDKYKKLMLDADLDLLVDDVKCGGAAINLTGATAKFRMRAVGGAVKINLATATIVDAPTGRVEYAWAGTDTDTAGDYDAEWVLTFGAAQQIVPNSGHIRVVIAANLA